jgi:hypothetical protein
MRYFAAFRRVADAVAEKCTKSAYHRRRLTRDAPDKKTPAAFFSGKGKPVR